MQILIINYSISNFKSNLKRFSNITSILLIILYAILLSDYLNFSQHKNHNKQPITLTQCHKLAAQKSQHT